MTMGQFVIYDLKFQLLDIDWRKKRIQNDKNEKSKSYGSKATSFFHLRQKFLKNVGWFESA